MKIITVAVFSVLIAAAMFIPAPKRATVVAVAAGDPPPLCPTFPFCDGDR